MEISLKSAQGAWADNIEGLVLMGRWKEAAASKGGLQIAVECNDFAPNLRPGDRVVVRKATNLAQGEMVMLVAGGELRFPKILKMPGGVKVEVTLGQQNIEIPLSSVIGKVAELHRYGERVDMRSGLSGHFSRLLEVLKRPVGS